MNDYKPYLIITPSEFQTRNDTKQFEIDGRLMLSYIFFHLLNNFLIMILQEFFQKIIDWNKIANKGKRDFTEIMKPTKELPDFNRHLETSMLMEEVAELLQAYKNKDDVEILDAFADIIFILVGSLAKYGMSASNMSDALEEVMQSNFSKFQTNENGELVCVKDEMGKIQKGANYRAPDIAKILNFK